jgi:hypothetical protein
VDKPAWTTFLVIATPSIIALSLVTLVRARPRSQVFLPFLPSLAVSIAIYIGSGGGAERFQAGRGRSLHRLLRVAGDGVLGQDRMPRVMPARRRVVHPPSYAGSMHGSSLFAA